MELFSCLRICREQHILFLFKMICLSVIIELNFQKYAYKKTSNWLNSVYLRCQPGHFLHFLSQNTSMQSFPSDLISFQQRWFSSFYSANTKYCVNIYIIQNKLKNFFAIFIVQYVLFQVMYLYSTYSYR
jgi:hypothetical protein